MWKHWSVIWFWLNVLLAGSPVRPEPGPWWCVALWYRGLWQRIFLYWPGPCQCYAGKWEVRSGSYHWGMSARKCCFPLTHPVTRLILQRYLITLSLISSWSWHNILLSLRIIDLDQGNSEYWLMLGRWELHHDASRELTVSCSRFWVLKLCSLSSCHQAGPDLNTQLWAHLQLSQSVSPASDIVWQIVETEQGWEVFVEKCLFL